MNKDEIRAALIESHERISQLITLLPEDAFLQPGVVGDWTIKDILAHLTRWEAELVKLLWQASQGIRPTSLLVLAIETDRLNDRWHAEDQSRPLDRILTDFHGVRHQVIRRLQDFKDLDMIDPARYPWLDGSPLWKWVADHSFDHDDEHLEQIQSWLGKRKKAKISESNP